MTCVRQFSWYGFVTILISLKASIEIKSVPNLLTYYLVKHTLACETKNERSTIYYFKYPSYHGQIRRNARSKFIFLKESEIFFNPKKLDLLTGYKQTQCNLWNSSKGFGLNQNFVLFELTHTLLWLVVALEFWPIRGQISLLWLQKGYLLSKIQPSS